MNESITFIPYPRLLIIFIPVALVTYILYAWYLDWKNSIYALTRMLIQLMIIGYFLTYIFLSNDSLIVLIILTSMVFIASWIALGTIPKHRSRLLQYAFISIMIGGGLTLLLVTQFVLKLDPWYMPRYMIPMAGMIFASSMNGVSLAAERLQAELERNINYDKAKGIALKASLIPITNSLFAVGLVSLPGMMTGQILSGISPHVAVRYQIMVMCMIFSAVGLSSYLFLYMNNPKKN
jgi:putative ABC transport system permease protein